MFDSITIPKVPNAVQKYVNTWAPDKDARMWMKGQNPLWVPNVPIDVIGREYVITNEQRRSMAHRILSDSIDRFGYADGPSKYMTSDCAKPDWPFTWPENPNQWRLAPQETTLAHVYWALQNCDDPVLAFNLMALQFLAYHNHGWWHPADKTNPTKWFLGEHEMTPSQWSELRNAGNATQNYGTRGRHRHVRGCIDYCVHMLRALSFLKVYDGQAVDYLQSKLTFHVSNLSEKFPLVDDPAGDHFGTDTPFVSVYQTAALWSILGEAAHVAVEFAARSKVEYLQMRIEELLIDYGPVVTADAGAPLHQWYYDIPFKDGKPRLVVPGEPGAQINNGIASVASYVVPMLWNQTGTYTSSDDLYYAMEANAKAKGWPTLHPAETAWAFGRVEL